MTLETVYYITQIIAVIAVVASLVFVGLQVRQGAEQTRLNTHAIKASASFEAAHSWAAINELATNWPDEWLVQTVKTSDPDANWEDFPLEIHLRMTTFYRAIFQKLEGQFYMHEYGSLDDDILNARCEWVASVIKLPFYQVLWEQEKAEKIYSEKFVAAIEALRDRAALTPFGNLQSGETAPAEEEPSE